MKEIYKIGLFIWFIGFGTWLNAYEINPKLSFLSNSEYIGAGVGLEYVEGNLQSDLIYKILDSEDREENEYMLTTSGMYFTDNYQTFTDIKGGLGLEIGIMRRKNMYDVVLSPKASLKFNNDLEFNVLYIKNNVNFQVSYSF